MANTPTVTKWHILTTAFHQTALAWHSALSRSACESRTGHVAVAVSLICRMAHAIPTVTLLTLILFATRSSAMQLQPSLQSLMQHPSLGQHQSLHDLPTPTAAGYLELLANATLFYSYHESQTQLKHDTPIVLWLQVPEVAPHTNKVPAFDADVLMRMIWCG